MGVKKKEEIQPGDLYEDCTCHAILCLDNDPDMDFIRGISLIDGSLKSCSLQHCGVKHITVAEAEKIKFEGPSDPEIRKMVEQPNDWGWTPWWIMKS